MLPKSDIDESAAVDICKVISEIAQDVVRCNLADVRLMTFMNRAARAVFGGQDKSTVLAVAVISDSIMHKSLLNLYFKFNKPKIPTKVFDKVDKGRAWLLEYLN